MIALFSYLRAPRLPSLARAVALPASTHAHAAATAEPEYQRWSCANCGEHCMGAKAHGVTNVAIVSVLFGLVLLAMSMPIGGLFLLAAALAPQRQPAMRCEYCKCGKFWTVSKKRALDSQ